MKYIAGSTTPLSGFSTLIPFAWIYQTRFQNSASWQLQGLTSRVINSNDEVECTGETLVYKLQ